MKFKSFALVLPGLLLVTSGYAQSSDVTTENSIKAPLFAFNSQEPPASAYEHVAAPAPKATDDVTAKTYGNNIVSLAPLQITDGIGIGLSYERILDKDGIISFYIPFAVSFTGIGSDPFVTTNGTTENNYRPAYYIMPGIKFYPTGSKGVVRYAVGPNFVYMKGEQYRNQLIYDDFGNVIGQDVGWRDQNTYGILVNNSLNISPTEHLHLGIELGLGFSYINQIAGINTDPIGLAQFNFNIGYRF